MRRTLPIKAIRDYYGEKIALYFCFLQHLLHLGYGLPLPALLGIVVQVFHFISMRIDRDLTAVRIWVDLAFAMYIAIFGTIFLETFNRVQYSYALEFGMINHTWHETQRPQHYGVPAR